MASFKDQICSLAGSFVLAAVFALANHATAQETDQTTDDAKKIANQQAETKQASEQTTADQTMEAAGLLWQTDYHAAYRMAKQQKKMLLINFVGNAGAHQTNLENYITRSDSLQKRLKGMVLVRLSADAEVGKEGKTTRLLGHSSFREMHGRPGIAIIDLQHEGRSYYGHVVSAFPFMNGKYYRWRSDYLATIVNLPPGTLTQRTMVWAVRVHPERPASTHGLLHPGLASAAASHSQHQANIRRQGHHNWDSRFHQVRAMVGVGEASEVVAESWPGQTMIDSCLDCVDSWRHSSGHWGAVRRQHRFFAYDIRRGRNGIWYGTGIFGN